MMHFAYPNVARTASNPLSTFHTCVRYLPFPSEQTPGPPYHPAKPHTSTLSAVREAALRLLPEWGQRGYQMQVYEKADVHGTYQGDSLDLAYLLALIRCACPLKLEAFAEVGDVWCTGTIRFEDEKPTLWSVSQEGFEAKLEGFIAQAHDHIFLVPAANVFHDQHQVCRAHNVHVLSLSKFGELLQSAKDTGRWQHKVIVTIEGFQLSQLVDTLFEQSAIASTADPNNNQPQVRQEKLRTPRRRNQAHWAIGFVSLITIIVALGWFVLSDPLHVWESFYHFPSDKIGVAIMAFSVSPLSSGQLAVKPYLYADDIRREIQKFIDPGGIRIHNFSHGVETPEAAQEWGRKKGAKIVVWGYAKAVEGGTRTYARVTLVEAFSPRIPVNSPLAEAAEWGPFGELRSSIPFLSAFTLDVKEQWLSASTSMEALTDLEVEVSQATLALLAVLSYLAKNKPQAIQFLTKLIPRAMNPYFPLALAALHMEQTAWRPAHNALERLKQLNPMEAKPWLLAALSYYRMGDDPAAIYAAERAAELDPSDPLIYIILRESYNRLEPWIDHEELDMKILSFDHPGSSIHSSLEASDKIHSGDIERAFEIISKDRRSNEYAVLALTAMAIKLIESGDKARSIAVMKTVLDRLGDVEKDVHNKFFYYLLLGLLAEQEGKIFEGEQYLNKLVEETPWSGDAYLLLADFYRRHGRIEEQISTYKNGIKKSTCECKYLLLENLASIYYFRNELLQAEEVHKSLSDTMPFYVKNIILLGVVYYNLGKFNEANDVFTNLIGHPLFQINQLKRTRSWLLKMLGDTRIALNDLNNAQIAYKEAISEDDMRGMPDKFIYYRLGLLAHREGDLNQAITMYKKELTSFTSALSWPTALLGVAYIDHGESQKAKELWEEFLKVAFNDITSRKTINVNDYFITKHTDKIIEFIIKDNDSFDLRMDDVFLAAYILKERSPKESINFLNKKVTASNYHPAYLPLLGLLYIEDGGIDNLKNKLLDFTNTRSHPELFPLTNIYSLTPTDKRMWIAWQ